VGLQHVHAHGSTQQVPYETMGSGSLAAMSVFETQWKENQTEESAIELVSNAVLAGISNDLGSGSNVDIVVIKASGTRYIREYQSPYVRPQKELNYAFERGTTAILDQKVLSREDISKYVTVHELDKPTDAQLGEAMNVDV
jgi:20S proteasome subunit beta 2